MIRRFNFTNRIRIQRGDLHITVREESGKFFFDADLMTLSEYGLPPESLVFVEAYRQTNWMRFNFGQVGAITPDKDRELKEFDSPEGILFRVKVTPNGDIHTLLAEADRIPLTMPDRTQGQPRPLLPVKAQKLGDEIYRVDFTGGAPILLINSEAGNYTDIGLSPAFVSLVYPQVFREILTRILIVEEHDDSANVDDWRSHWIKFAQLHPGIGEMPDLEDQDQRSDWVEKAVAVFAKKLQLRAKFIKFWEKEKQA